MKDYSEAKADLGRSKLSLLAANKKEWVWAERFSKGIKNPELRAITFTHLAKMLEKTGDSERQNGFVETALDVVKNMPEGEEPERVLVLYDLQRLTTDSALAKKVDDSLDRERKHALDQIESRVEEHIVPKESIRKSLRLREQVRLLALAAEVASYAGERATIKEKLEDAKDKLNQIKDGHDRSIAFHLLIEGTARCVVADPNGTDFYKTYLNKLMELLPTSSSAIEHVLGLIEVSAIILRATPPDAVTKLASDFLHQAEDLASNLRPDSENKKQPSEQTVQSPASFLLREVRTLRLTHAKRLVEHGDMQVDLSIALVRQIQERLKKEMPGKVNVGPERLDLLLTQLAVAKAFSKMDKPNDVKEVLSDVRMEARKLHNPHQKSAVLRSIVEIAVSVDTGSLEDNVSATPDKQLMDFAQDVLNDESLDPSDKGWATASYAIGRARQANKTRNATGGINRVVDRVLGMPSILWELLGGCTNHAEFSESIMKADQSGPARNYALYGVARELARAQYLDCAHEKLRSVSDNDLQTSGYAEVFLDDSADILALPKINVLTLSDQVRPEPHDQDQVVSMRLVPGGYFIMGALHRDVDKSQGIDRNPPIDQSPPHHVYLNTFHIDEHEVTVDQYAQFLKNNPHEDRPQEWGDATFVRTHRRKPVVGITYEKATQYCEWAGKRLPTEAEWEKAARGTDGRIYPWGNDPPTSRHANFGKLEWNHYGVLESVDLFEDGKSPYGVYNMAGNVWEWVEDWYSTSAYIHSSPANPHGPEVGNWRVLRGGAWDNDTKRIEATYRLYKDPPYYFSTIGFRCAK